MSDQQAIYITPEVIAYNPSGGLVNRGNAQTQRQSQNLITPPTAETASSNYNNPKKFIGPPMDANGNSIGPSVVVSTPVVSVAPRRTIGIPNAALICALIVLAVLIIIGGIVFLIFIHRITVINQPGIH